jgi:predicted dehydrogenase
LEAFSRSLAGRNLHLWPAAPLRHAAAHRAARRLIERDGLGPVKAMQLRWPQPLDGAHIASAYAAFDLLLSFLPSGAAMARSVVAGAQDGLTSLWMNFAGGGTATALFGAADTWNSPLPRLEVAGTEGRFLVCEAGRRLSHYTPREGSRSWDPPGMAAYVSSANVAGVSEDVKAFLAACTGTAPLFGAETVLTEAARALGLLEAARRAVESRAMETVENRSFEGAPRDPGSAAPAVTAENLTLQLGLH